MPLKDPPEDPAAVARRMAIEQRVCEEARYPVTELTARPWTQGQPRNQRTNMQVAMFLREVREAADGLCIRTCATIADDDKRSATHKVYMLIIDVTHPKTILAADPPVPDDAAHAADFPPAGVKRDAIQRLDRKMLAITDPGFHQHLSRIADDDTKLQGRRSAWVLHEISCTLEAGTFVMTFSVTLEYLQLRQSNSQSMRDYLAASSAAQYRVTQCFVDNNTKRVDYGKLWKFLGTCQLFRNSCSAFQKVALMQIMTMQDGKFTSQRLVEIADRQDALNAGQHAQHQHHVAALTDQLGHSNDDIAAALSALDEPTHSDHADLDTAQAAERVPRQGSTGRRYVPGLRPGALDRLSPGPVHAALRQRLQR